MARINVDDIWWCDSRRLKLIELMKGNSRLADGLMLQAWRLAQDHCIDENGSIPLSQFLCLSDSDFLFECDLVVLIQANTKQTPSKAKEVIANSKQDAAIADSCQAYVRGSEKYHKWLLGRRKAGKSGGIKSAKRTRKGGKLQANTKQNEANDSNHQASSSSSSSCSSSLYSSSSLGLQIENSETEVSTPKFSTQLWEFYANAIEVKYRGRPERNAKTNSQIVAFLKQVPEREAMEVLDHYLKHPNAYYGTQMHQLGPMLQDAGKLLLEVRSGQLAPERNYQNGKAANGKWLTHDEKKRQNTMAAVDELCAEIRARDSGGDFNG